MRRVSVAILLLSLMVNLCRAEVDESVKRQLSDRLAELQVSVEKLPLSERVDAEVCAKAVEWILRHDEFYRPNYVQSAERTLELGFERCEQLEQSKSDWGRTPGVHALAYRSRIDNSAQPYLVTLPPNYDHNSPQRWPLYVVLHGRNGRLTEAHFVASQNGQSAPEEQNWIQLDVFGRTNNAYRWAGETDVFESLEDVIRRYKIDESRITLWGFSMGGAGAWHLGLHHPSRWASVGAGAGFVDFYTYQKQTEQLPEYQHRALKIYDAHAYALNLSTVPFITYGGEKDPQLLASRLMEQQAKELNVPLEVLVGPNMGHKFDDASKAAFMQFLGEHNQRGRKRVPGIRDIRFVTYTLKYNTCEWLTIEEMEVPYARTTVTSTLNDDAVLVITTQNVSAMSIDRTAADRVLIDDDGPYDLISIGDGNLLEVYFVKEPGGWTALDYDESLEFEDNPLLKKRHNLQGPIDDAFMEPFVCVTPTGTPWSAELQQYALGSLDRFANEYDRWLRAEPLIISDQDVTETHLKDRHLILFGDPGSNTLIRKVVNQLPLDWQADSISFGGGTYSTRDHAIVLIYPNPLNPRKYVVINSGMTMHEKDFKASNSWLFPKLGDYAVLKFDVQADGTLVETVLEAGIFDAHWNRTGRAEASAAR